MTHRKKQLNLAKLATAAWILLGVVHLEDIWGL